jgi:hypothetical protein
VFAILEKAVVRRMTVQVIQSVLQPELPLIGYNLLYELTKRGIIYVLYVYDLQIHHACNNM